MAHPVIWPKKSFFYPIGNTVPVCFTRELSPEEDANILLLACGDPRSILYTVYADHAPAYRHMDFTCCDWEPAILARNVLLLTMVVDGVSHQDTWPIFYHFFLDDKSHNVLLEQCRKLIDSSVDAETWKKSRYGQYIRFCTYHTMSEIRHHLCLYLSTAGFSHKTKENMKSSFAEGMQKVRKMYPNTSNFMRAAGPLSLRSGFDKFWGRSRDFWTSGIVRSKALRSSPTPHLNPTFAYSRAGGKFNVHYGTDPFNCFFLAQALAPVQGGTSFNGNNYGVVADVIVGQFSSWCSTFQNRIALGTASNLIIRLFVGESLAFCRSLYACKREQRMTTGIYAYPWGGMQIDLDPDEYAPISSYPAPLRFNVIETSNLADHTGLINLLLVTVPLLCEDLSSVLYTDTLLRSSSEGPAVSGIPTKAFSDVPSLSILLGVAPTSHLSHFTTYSNKHEVLTSELSWGQLLEPITWKHSPHTTKLSTDIANGKAHTFVMVCNEMRLAEFIFAMYIQMFSDEDMYNVLRKVGMDILNKMSVTHYNRASLAAFVGFVRSRVDVDWTRVMDHLNHLLCVDRSLLMGTNNYQDLICEFYLRGLFDSLEVFQPHALKNFKDPSGIFSSWKDIPPVVCIVLKVPRSALKRLESLNEDKVQTPAIQCESRTPQGHNIHSSIQPVFGDLEFSFADGEPHISINEDSSSWEGNSSLIVTFYVNTWIVLQHPPETIQFGLHVRSSPAVVIALMPIFGMNLMIYATNLLDKDHLHVVRHRPNNIGEVKRRRKLSIANYDLDKKITDRVSLGFDDSGKNITRFILRDTITNSVLAKSLSEGANVITQPLDDYTIQVSFKGYEHQFTYPFPIRTGQTKTKIARKSAYIEVEVPIRSDFSDSLDFSFDPFPISCCDRKISNLNIHYVNLDILPPLTFPVSKEHLQWLSPHLGLSFSSAEKERHGRKDYKDHGRMVNIKESIGTIFLKYSESEDPKFRHTIFALTNPKAGVGVYTLIFVNAIKLDLSSHTVIADACVVPLHTGIMTKITPVLGKLTRLGLLQIQTLDHETHAWKKLLPAFVERCRKWKHTSKCEYYLKGIPLDPDEGTDFETSLLCNCGKGKNLGAFGQQNEWKLLHSEAVRIAFSPLFSFSFLDGILSSMSQASMDTKNSRSLPVSTSSPSAIISTACANCFSPGNPTLQVCGGCKKVKYCSRSCQKGHWKVHKPACTS